MSRLCCSSFNHIHLDHRTARKQCQLDGLVCCDDAGRDSIEQCVASSASDGPHGWARHNSYTAECSRGAIVSGPIQPLQSYDEISEIMKTLSVQIRDIKVKDSVFRKDFLNGIKQAGAMLYSRMTIPAASFVAPLDFHVRALDFSSIVSELFRPWKGLYRK